MLTPAPVAVGLSGGVDSAVAAALLQDAGHPIVGVHLRLVDAPVPDAPGLVAEALGIRLHVHDARRAFAAGVVAPWEADYLCGQTPNPCSICNPQVKLPELLAAAAEVDCDLVATGHYARLCPELHAGADASKDQSYFLARVPGKILARLRLPLGELTKAAVRAEALRRELPVARSAESQEICFVPDDDYPALLAARHPGLDASGDIVGPDGAVVGRHPAFYRYTRGQRRGLHVALGRRAWVTRIDAASRRVHLSTDPSDLLERELRIGGCTWYDRPALDEEVQVRIRHRGHLLPGRVGTGEPARILLGEPARAIAPGQVAVLYSGTRVRGAGRILLREDA